MKNQRPQHTRVPFWQRLANVVASGILVLNLFPAPALAQAYSELQALGEEVAQTEPAASGEGDSASSDAAQQGKADSTGTPESGTTSASNAPSGATEAGDSSDASGALGGANTSDSAGAAGAGNEADSAANAQSTDPAAAPASRASANLRDFLMQAQVQNATTNTEGQLVVQEGSTYTVLLQFAEKPTLQFANDQELVLALPEGFVPAAEQPAATEPLWLFFTNEAGERQPVELARDSWHVENNAIHLRWRVRNESERTPQDVQDAYDFIFSLENAQFELAVAGTFAADATQVDFGAGPVALGVQGTRQGNAGSAQEANGKESAAPQSTDVNDADVAASVAGEAASSQHGESTLAASSAPSLFAMLRKVALASLSVVQPEDASQEDANLTSFLRSVDINAPTNESGAYVFTAGSSYTFRFAFGENDDVQFHHDGTLSYPIPSGLTFSEESSSGTFSIVINDGNDSYTIQGNTYKIENGSVKVQINEGDPNIAHYNDSANVRFNLAFDGTVDESVTKIDFGNGIAKDVVVDKSSSVKATKYATVDLANKKVHYQLSVTSTGNSKNVVLTDTIASSNNVLALDGGSIGAYSSTGQAVSMEGGASGNSFTYAIASMKDGEVVTLTYDANINTANIPTDSNGVIQVVEGTNKASARNDYDPTPSEVEVKTTIDYQPGVQKDAMSVQEDGKTLDCSFTFNGSALVSGAGYKLTDTLGQYLTLAGDGVTVQVYDASGTLVRTNDPSWGSPGLSGEQGGTTFTYTVPEDDAGKNYKYVVSYQAKATLPAGTNSQTTVSNTVKVENTNKTSTNTGVVTPSNSEALKLFKTADSVDYSQGVVNWTVTINVPESGLGESNATLTDKLSNEKGYTESIKYSSASDIAIVGLTGTETYDVALEGTDHDTLKITFYKDAAKTTKGLDGQEGGRQIVVKFQSTINKDWVKASETNSWYLDHVNTADLGTSELDPKATASVQLAGEGVVKSSEVAGYRTTATGVQLPVYKYTLLLHNVTSANNVIEDTFDRSILAPLYTIDSWGNNVAVDGFNPDWFSWHTTNATNNGRSESPVTYADTTKGINIITNDASMVTSSTSTTGYYPVTKIIYYLTVKDEAALLRLRAKAAAAANGKAELENEAEWNGTSKSTVEYQYPALSKEILTSDDDLTKTDSDIWADFRIAYNPDAAQLNNGATTTLTDHVENLSVDITSIRVSPEGMGITYDMTGNDLVFQNVPDSTGVTITYKARVIYTSIGNTGDTINVNFSNTASTNNGYTSTVSKTAHRHNSGAGVGSVYSINLMKYAAGDMDKKLKGAVFELYHAKPDSSAAIGYVLDESSPVTNKTGGTVTLTTNDQGMIEVVGHQDADGWHLNANTYYFLREVTSPEGYMLSTNDYAFRITEDGTTDYARYVYHNADTMSAKNYPGTDLYVHKIWSDDPQDQNGTHDSSTVTVRLQQKFAGESAWRNSVRHQSDGTWQDSQMTIALNGDGDWRGVFRSLPLSVPKDLANVDGEDVAVTYQIKEVAIDGTPADTSTTNATAGSNSDFAWAYGTETETSGTVERTVNTITNTPQGGSLKLRKLVTVDGQPTQGTLADGTYSFTVTGPTGAASPVTKNVSITIRGGTIASATGDVVKTGDAATIANGFVEVTDLPAGTYTISEATPTNGTSLVGENNKTVTVAAGQRGANVAAAGQATFTNNMATGGLKVTKNITRNGSSELTNVVKGRMAGTYTFTLFQDEACTQPVTQPASDGSGEERAVTLSVTMGTDGQPATSSEITGLAPGEYWVQEAVTATDDFPWAPVQNPVKVTVKAGKTGSQAATASFTNNIEVGSLRLRKLTTVNGQTVDDFRSYVQQVQKDGEMRYPTDGEYRFQIRKDDPSTANDPLVAVRVWIQNGVMAAHPAGPDQLAYPKFYTKNPVAGITPSGAGWYIAPLTIDDGWVQVDDLVPGTYYVKERTSEMPDGMKLGTITLDGATQAKNEVQVQVTAGSVTSVPAVSFTNNYTEVADLEISKQIVSTSSASQYANRDFTFTVTLLGERGQAVSGTYGDLTFTNGVATFTLRDDETKTATGLPTGIQYEVTEAADPDFTLTGITVNGTGQGARSTKGAGTISVANNPSQVEFTNTLKEGGFTVAKQVNSTYAPDRQATRKFHFVVTLTGSTLTGTFGGMTFSNGRAEFDLAHGQSLAASGLPIGTSYTVSETAEDGFATTWTGGTTGTVQDGGNPTITATNQRMYGGIQVQKTVVSNDSAADQPFEFTITLANNGISGTYGDLTFVNGVATVALRNGESASTGAALPYGLGYQVTETEVSGYTLTGHTGDVGTIGQGIALASFTNTKNQGGLSLYKSVSSPLASDEQRAFTFTIAEVVPAGHTATSAGKTFTDGLGNTITFNSQGVAQNVRLRHNQTISVTGLEVGSRFRVTENLQAQDAQLFSTTASTSSRTTPQAVTTIESDAISESAPSQVRFANTRNTGSLKLQKTVVSDASADANQSFDFTVTLSDSTLSGTYGDLTFVNGVATASLSHNQSVTATGLPQGITYTITEATATGFALTGIATNGTPAAAGTTQATGAIGATESQVTFTNTRNTGSLSLSKALASAAAADADYEFTFTVRLSDTAITKTYGDMSFTNGEATVRLKKGATATATGLPQGITYTITEATATGFALTGIATNGTPAAAGTTQATGTIGAAPSAVEFTNTRTLGGLKVAKTLVSDAAADASKEFTFNVELADNTISGTFSGVEFTGGKGSFTLRGGEEKEIGGLPTGVSYTVTEQSAPGFTLTGTAKRNGTIATTPATITYTNTRDTGDLRVTKKVVSEATADANIEFPFTVTLYRSEDDTSDAGIDTTISKTYGNMTFKDGVATFTLKKDQETTATGLPQGIYYVVRETSGTGFTQSGTIGESGTIGSTLSSAEFTNTRELGGFRIQKHVESAASADKTKEFTFTATLSGAPVTGTYGDLQFVGGVATFTLKDGETKQVSGLPVGVSYTVTESGEFGFTTYGSAEASRAPLGNDANSNPTQQGTITSDPATMAFYNVRNTGNLKVQKAVRSTYVPDATRRFDFRVELTGAPVAIDSTYTGTITRAANGATEPVGFSGGVATFQLAANDVFQANDLPAGTSYSVTETAADGFATTWEGDAGTIANGETAQATATNARSYGRLDVSKAVVSHQASDFDRPFSFTVTFFTDEHKTQQATNLAGTYAIGSGDPVDFTDGQATFALEDGQTASFAGLPLGLYYTVGEASVEGMTPTSTGSEGSVRSTTAARFTNLRSEGGLFVSKRVSSPLSADADQEFAFTVTLYNDAALQSRATQVNGTYGADGAASSAGAMSFQAGQATFTLKDGQTAYAFNLPNGLYYQVEEAESPNFTTTVQTGSTAEDERVATGAIAQNDDAHVLFANTRKRGNLEVAKRLLDVNGNEVGESTQEFAIRVELYDRTINGTYGQMTFVNGVADFTIRANQVVSTANAAVADTDDAYYTLPIGMRYRVTETHANGYTTSWTNTTKGVKYSYDISQTWSAQEGDGTTTYAPSTERKTITWTDASGTHTSTFLHDLDYVANGAGTRLDSWASADASTEWGWVDDARPSGDTTVQTSGISTNATDNVTFTNRPEVAPLTVFKAVQSPLSADTQQAFRFRVVLEDASVSGTYGDMEFAGGVAEFDLRDGEHKTAQNLPKGVRYRVFESEVAGFGQQAINATGTLGYGPDGKELMDAQYLPAGSEPDARAQAGYANSRLPGKLTVSKVVRSSSPTSQKFHFTVTLYHDAERQAKATEVDGSYPLVLSPGDEESLAFAQGVATFDLADGEQVQIANLPSGLYYQVDEATDAGFTTAWAGQAGTIGSEGNDATAEGATAVATNTRKEGTLTVSKRLVSDRADDASTQFLFVVDLFTDAARTNKANIVGTYGDMEFAIDKNGNDRARVVLRGGESATATGLPEGVYYKVSETKIVTVNSDGDTKDVDITGFTTSFTNGKNTGAILSDAPQQVEGVNTRTTGTLVVAKAVRSDRASDHTSAPFTLVVTLSDRTINGTYGDMTFQDGVAHVLMTGEQEATATGLPTDIAYTVTEESALGFERQGWTVREGEGSEQPGNSGTIKVETDSKGKPTTPVVPVVQRVTITNARYTGGLTVTKQVESLSEADKDPSKKFRFTVTLSDTSIDGSTSSSGDPYGVEFINGVASFDLAHGESKEIQNLPVDVTYTVTEDEDESGDFELTGTTGYTGTISRAGSSATLTNTRVTSEPTTARLRVTKSFNDWSANDAFEFTLAAGGNTAEGNIDTPMPQGNGNVATATKDAVDATFGSITYRKEGVYDYTIVETPGTDQGIAYDAAVHPVRVTVSRVANTNDLAATVEYGEEDGTWGSALVVTNRRALAQVSLQATKSLKEWGNGHTFEFTLTAGENTAEGNVATPMPAKAGGASSMSATVTKSAPTAVFGEVTYRVPGEYRYTIQESAGTGPYNYDTSAHSVLVTVERNEETGELAATATYDDGNADLVITNTGKPTFEKKIRDTNDSTGEASSWQDSADYDMGDAVPYKLTATLPADVTAYRTYHLTFTDTMENTLAFNEDSVEVYLNGAKLDASTYTLTKLDDHNFTVRLDWGDGTNLIGDESLNKGVVDVYFTATLGANANLGKRGNVNAAKLAFSNNPNAGGSGGSGSGGGSGDSGGEGPNEESEGELPWDYVIAFTYQLNISKVDASAKPLEGAQFKLEKLVKGANDAEDAYVEVGLSANKSTYSAIGLDDGIYRLTETKAPAGYQQIDPITFTVEAGHAAAWDRNSDPTEPADFEVAGRTSVLESLTGTAEDGELELAASKDLAALSGSVANKPVSPTPTPKPKTPTTTTKRTTKGTTARTGDATNFNAVLALLGAGALLLFAGSLRRLRDEG